MILVTPRNGVFPGCAPPGKSLVCRLTPNPVQPQKSRAGAGRELSLGLADQNRWKR